MTQPSFAYLAHHHWLLFDDAEQSPPLSAHDSLAYQDSFIRWLPQHTSPNPQAIIHFYAIDRPTVLLGAKDRRLPALEKGLRYLHHQGYDYALRPHGGLGVVCDPGVLNIALASDLRDFPLSIDQAYEQMVQLIGLSLLADGLKLESYEIPQSYCPGRYDLVVAGQKIGGIAQRRFKTGVTTAAYISVEGQQAQRAQLMADFYRLSQADASYPQVDSTVMASLSDLTPEPISRQSYQERIMALIAHYQTLELGSYDQPELVTIFKKMQEVALERTQSLTSPL